MARPPWPDVDRLERGVELVGSIELGGLAVGLAALHFCSFPWWSWCGPRTALPRTARVRRSTTLSSSTVMPIERAVPAMIFAAWSMSFALRSGILVCAISRTWSVVTLATLVLCGSPQPLSTPAAFEQQPGGRRGLGDEGERAVLVDRDLDRDDLAALRLGGRVVLLAELHDVHAVLAQRGADRRGRGRPAPAWICSLMTAASFFLGGIRTSVCCFWLGARFV